MKYWMTLSLLPLLFSHAVLAEQSAIVLKDTQILVAPVSSAEILASIPKDTQVTLLKRKGGWYQIETDEYQVGWLRMLKVRFLSEQESNQKSIAKILRETAIMPPASGVSSGVRGMSDDDMNQNNKQSNQPLEFDQLKNFIPAEESVLEFAEQGKLRTQDSVVLPTE